MGIFALVISLGVFLLLGMPIAFSLGLSSVIYLITEHGFSMLVMLPQRLFAGSNSFILTALPFFIFAGLLMNEGEITPRIINFCLALVGRLRGGLGLVNILASMIFGGISGSSVSDTAAIGSILIPAMKKKGYDEDFSAGVTVASSTVGMIIPPSIPLVIYAVSSDTSIGKLFLGGAIPGILIGLFMMIVCYIFSVYKGYPIEIERFSLSRLFVTLKKGILALIMPLVIIGGIVGGVVTPTEAGCLAVVYAAVVGFFVYRKLKLSNFLNALVNVTLTTAVIMFIVACATIFSWVLAYEHIPQKVSSMLLSVSTNPMIVLLVVNVFMLICGTFLDVGPAIIILTPVLLPTILTIGIDPIHFGVIMIINLAIGLDTPPVGNCLNVASRLTNMSIVKIGKSALPFLVANLMVLFLASYYRPIVMFLPDLLMK